MRLVGAARAEHRTCDRVRMRSAMRRSRRLPCRYTRRIPLATSHVRVSAEKRPAWHLWPTRARCGHSHGRQSPSTRPGPPSAATIRQDACKPGASAAWPAVKTSPRTPPEWLLPRLPARLPLTPWTTQSRCSAYCSNHILQCFRTQHLQNKQYNTIFLQHSTSKNTYMQHNTPHKSQLA